MAERKRRPPSGKIKPGTAHPTKAYTVRGFDGRWISRKAYNAAKRAREKKTTTPTKGGSLAKRVSSAITKTSKGALTKASKAGDLLKIKKGDKGIVRAIKDTFRFGQDTRKSVNAAYKAGKITRQVHDKLVRGGKEFVKGTVESGKATRRVYERLKPGGKIVKTKGNKLTKYKKPNSKIVRSPSGKLVRSPGGKLVRNPGGKLVRNPGGKLTNRPKVKTQKYTAPKTRIPTKGKFKVDGKTVYTKRDIKGDITSKVKGVKSKVNKTINTAKSGTRQTWATRPLVNVAKQFTKPGKLQNIKSLTRGLRSAANLKSLGIGLGLNWAADQAVDRTFRAISGKNKMSLKEYRAWRNKRLNSIGNKDKNKLKTWKDPYKGPKQPDISTGTYQGGSTAEEIGTYQGGDKAEKIGTYKGGSKAEPLGKSENKSARKKTKLTPAQKEAKDRKAWEKKTRNSPARKSGAFTADQLWEQQKKHRKWKKRMGRN